MRTLVLWRGYGRAWRTPVLEKSIMNMALGVFITSLVGILIMLLIPPKGQEHWGFYNWNSGTPN